MNLDAIRIPAIQNDQESLTAALLSLFPDANDEALYDDVNAALGLSMMIAVQEENTSPAEWVNVARDARLKSAASLFGMRLRELHPPDAANGLSATPQYRVHFLDSYRPLICIALDRDQPVLAWQGWETKLTGRWGIITQSSGGDLGLAGIVSPDGNPEPLITPPTQCYVVEKSDPLFPSDADLIRCFIDNAADSMCGRLSADTKVATGLAAYDRWQTLLTKSLTEADVAEHRLLVGSIISNRKSALRFCQSHAPTAAEAALNRLTAIAECATRTIKAFAPICEAGSFTDTGVAIKALSKAIEDAKEAELDVAKVIA